VTSYKRTRFPGTKVFDCFTFGLPVIFIATKHIYVTVSRPIFGYVIKETRYPLSWRPAVNKFPAVFISIHALDSSLITGFCLEFDSMDFLKNGSNWKQNEFKQMLNHISLPYSLYFAFTFGVKCNPGQNVWDVFGLSCIKIAAHVYLRPTPLPPPFTPLHSLWTQSNGSSRGRGGGGGGGETLVAPYLLLHVYGQIACKKKLSTKGSIVQENSSPLC